jgi:hypothetical protein
MFFMFYAYLNGQTCSRYVVFISALMQISADSFVIFLQGGAGCQSALPAMLG